ncbi:MAG TPA: phosphonate ABC transporter, permease protein PhnE [Roseiarcus sp.]|nr:phosphonate ABC transporter, permease protein PhnE [Roseiarcus sp.]
MPGASPSAIVVLPEERRLALQRSYARAGAAGRVKGLVVFAALLIAVAIAVRVAEIDPATFWRKIGGFTSYVDRIATLDSGQRVWTNPIEWFWGLRRWLRLLGETLLTSYVGTLWGAAAAFILCFAASANTCQSAALRFCAKRFLEFCRTVPAIVFALVFVVAFGLGPLPGVLALAVHTVGTLGKLFSEVVENADMKPMEGVKASGATLVEIIRFGVLPQILSNFATYTLLRFEINVREATVMGFVGAGGIGDEFLIAIRSFYYSDISAILVLIILTVFIIDLSTEQLRRRFLSDRVK